MTHLIVTIALAGLFAAGLIWGDSEKGEKPLFFIGALAMIALATYWIYHILCFAAAL